MNDRKDIFLNEYKRLLQENKILSKRPLNLSNFKEVVAIMQQLTLNTFKIETLKCLINK